MPSPKKNTPHARNKRELDALAENARRLDAEIRQTKINSPLRLGVKKNAPETDLGTRLQEARQLAGFTQEQVAKLTVNADEAKNGLSSAVISLYERGINRPGPKEMRLLCEVLRVTPSYLIYGADDPFDNLEDLDRFGGWATTDAEFLSKLTYCFSRLHHHHRRAMFDLMLGLLRGWNKDFDSDLATKADPAFLSIANELRDLIDSRKTRPKK